MFGLFKRKVHESKDEPRPRVVLPTYLSDNELVLCKASSTIRNAYEIRLALFLAVSRKARFILQVRPGAEVEPALRAHVEHYGGLVQEKDSDFYSVYIGYAKPSGEEGYGWVLGDEVALSLFHDSLRSHWCRHKITVGSSIAGSDLATLERELRAEKISQKNTDGENLRDALLTLTRAAMSEEGGTIFVQ